VVSNSTDGLYHCTTRCVRQARLMGTDPVTKKDFSHRRQWVIERLELLASALAIDVCFFAVMANHLHVILRTWARRVKRMGTYEVARRWLRVCPGKRVLEAPWPEPTEEQVEALAKDKKKIKEIRKRLSSVSWFMSLLDENIARRANAEDNTKGRFWSGRFHCRLVDGPGALLTCGIYNDLNPFRAGECQMPHLGGHTSFALRLEASQGGQPCDWLAPLTLDPAALGEAPSDSGRRCSDKGLLPLTLEQYGELMAWAAAEAAEGKQTMPRELAEQAAAQIRNMGLNPAALRQLLESFPGPFRRMLGPPERMAEQASEVGLHWFQGVAQAGQVFTDGQHADE
jgi:hypothetical protein